MIPGLNICILILAIFSYQCLHILAQYNSTEGEICVYLSSAAFCATSSYLTRTFIGPTAGFVATMVIYDEKTDLTGYMGYLPSSATIYIIFRGTDSYKNWAVDGDILKVPYASAADCQGCEVHMGFDKSEQRVFASILAEVRRLQALFPSYRVKTTGHSLGAAIAQLTSVDLVLNGVSCEVYNFGQPRTGFEANFHFFMR
jgi:hypothetical protein